MKIILINSFDKTDNLGDLVLFVDIFRASTTIVTLFANNATKIVGVKSLQQAQEFVAKNYLLVSEVYDGGYDNSPTQLLGTSIAGKKFVHKSTNLTSAIFSSSIATKSMVVSFINARSTCRYIQSLQGISEITIVMSSSYFESKESIEDRSCAEYIKSILLNYKFDEDKYFVDLKLFSTSFLDDYKYCLQRDIYDTYVFVEKYGDCLEYVVENRCQ